MDALEFLLWALGIVLIGIPAVIFGIPCLTVRENTERPATITQGTNRLCHLDDLKRMAGEILE